MPVSGQSTEELEQNYVPMSANSPSHHHSGSLSEPVHEANYVPMTPSTMEFSSLGKQVPPPAHMGFRSSPKTPPRRPILSDCQPPPVDRNLKPDRKGEGEKRRACTCRHGSQPAEALCQLACHLLMTVLHLTNCCCSQCAVSWCSRHLYKLASFISAFIFIVLCPFVSSHFFLHVDMDFMVPGCLSQFVSRVKQKCFPPCLMN